MLPLDNREAGQGEFQQTEGLLKENVPWGTIPPVDYGDSSLPDGKEAFLLLACDQCTDNIGV